MPPVIAIEQDHGIFLGLVNGTPCFGSFNPYGLTSAIRFVDEAEAIHTLGYAFPDRYDFKFLEVTGGYKHQISYADMLKAKVPEDLLKPIFQVMGPASDQFN